MPECLNISILWKPRFAPLSPVAVAARGAAGRALADRLLMRDPDATTRLEGVTWRDLILLVGAEADLPWSDGAIYLGRDPAAPELLLPTALLPSVPLPLLERALRRQAANAALPLAVLPQPEPVLLPVGRARPVDRDRLKRWRVTV